MLARRILVATDGSDHSIRALEYAQSFVHGHAISIAAIHVVSGEMPPPRSLDDQPEFEDPEALGRRILADTCHFLGLPEEDVEQILAYGEAAGQIVKAAAEFKADLIIMGSRGLSFWKGQSQVGSVSQAVLKAADCSVLVVKEQVEHRQGVG